MILQGKRIRNFDKHFNYLQDGQKVIFGVSDVTRFAAQLSKAGFPANASIGTTILPSAKCGPVCRFNAEGKQVIRRDLPKETAYRQVEWHWTERHGNNPVEQTGIKDVSYQRYPRDFIPPPSVEISLLNDVNGNTLIAGPTQTIDKSDTSQLMHVVNVFLNIFGECQAFTEDGTAIIRATITRLNWTILPSGQRPWPQLKSELTPILNQLTSGKQQVASYRLQLINEYGPDFVATGRAGFNGYLIFGFLSKGLFLCESIFTGNATYVFDGNWQALSQRTKAEILNNNLQVDRLIHLTGWATKIDNLLK